MSRLRLIRLIGITIMFITAVLIANYTIITHTPQNTPETQATKPVKLRILFGKESNEPNTASLKITASYHIKVYRDGKLVAERHKENDPITIQWYRMVANMMFGFIRSGALTWYDTEYNSRTWVDTDQYGIDPKMYIALGSGSGTPSLYDYKLFNEVTKDVASMSVTVDSVNERYIVMYTKTFTITSGFTLTEVGLVLYVDVDTTNSKTGRYLLVAHDSVSPSIDLASGDSVSITYQLTIPYNSNGVFTRWFYNALINYWLGYKGTTGSSLTLKAESGYTGIIDTAADEYYNYDHDPCDIVDGEYTYIEIGKGSSTTSPLFETYRLGNRLQRKKTTGTQCIAEVNETDIFQMHYIVSFTFTSSASITEIGFSYYTDRKGGDATSADYYLWCYWSLPSAINVDAGDGLRVEITIEIPYT